MSDNTSENTQTEKSPSYIKILKALIELMEDRTLSEIAVKEISHKAGLSRRTFYSYFSSVNDAINGYLKYLADCVYQEIDNLENIDDSISITLLTVFDANLHPLKILMKDESIGSDHLLDTFFSFLEKRLNEKLLPSNKIFEPYYVFYMGGVYQLVRSWVISENPLPLNDMIIASEKIRTAFKEVDDRFLHP